jgi:crossover junction endodeoxyribonuclease RuvC
LVAAFLLLQPGRHWQAFLVGISPQQFEQMQARLGAKPARTAATAVVARQAGSCERTILGIDPSLRGTGYGVIRASRSRSVSLAHGTIACPKNWDRSRCLGRIAGELRALLVVHRPDLCVVEGLFFAQNLKTAIIMGEARGAALAVVAESGVEIFELATRKVKLAIVGYGGAQKIAVAKMVQRLLSLPELPAPDAADALALAVAFAQEQGRFSLKPPQRI